MEDDGKDRLGEQLKEKGKGEEERFYGAKERQAIERLKKRQGLDVVPEAVGHCPRCGATLNPITAHGVAVLQCPVDCGTWVDRGELEVVAKRERNSWLGRMIYGPKLEE